MVKSDSVPATVVRFSPLFLGLAGALGFLAVSAGAFGAHALKESFTPYQLEIWETAAHYNLVHAAVLFGVALLAGSPARGLARVAGICFSLGTVIFSGTLYALALSGMRALGMITPIGGTLMIIGWGCLLAIALRARKA